MPQQPKKISRLSKSARLFKYFAATTIMMFVAMVQLSVPAHAQNMSGDPPVSLENGSGRYPYKIIVLIDNSPNQGDGGHNTEYDGSIIGGKSIWGHQCYYDLELLDNHGNAYGLGDIEEFFSNVKNTKYIPAGSGQGSSPGSGDTWLNGSGFISGKWTDHNDAIENFGETGRSTLWLSFDQSFHSINSPAGEYDQDPPFHLQIVQAHPTRS